MKMFIVLLTTLNFVSPGATAATRPKIAAWQTPAEKTPSAVRIIPIDHTRTSDNRLAVIEEADAFLAEITPPDGSPNVSSDVAFAIGFALARGKPTLIYTKATQTFADRVISEFKARGHSNFQKEPDFMHRLMDPDGYAVEDFGLWENLMIDGAAHHSLVPIGHTAAEVIAAYLARKPTGLSKASFTFDSTPSLVRAILKSNAPPDAPFLDAGNFRKVELHPRRRHPDDVPLAYLAGPDVFLKDPLRAAEIKRKICRTYGFGGKFPLDVEMEFKPPASEFAMRIFYANLRLMLESDFIVANMTPYRGPDMDQGTAFEQGFTFGLGRPVLGYSTFGSSVFPPARLAKFAVERSGHSIVRRFTTAIAWYRNSLNHRELKALEESIDFCPSLLINGG